MGYSGSGTLNVLNGGVVSDVRNCAECSAAVVGYSAGVNAGVAVSGSGSSWNNTGVVNVGYIGNGTLAISSGGQVSTQGLVVGSLAYGTLSIASGGQLSNTVASASIGDVAGSHGAVTVSDAGSVWTNAPELVVGNAGNGTLTIQNGGIVNGSNAVLGVGSGSSG